MKIFKKIFCIAMCVVLIFMCSTASFAESDMQAGGLDTVEKIDSEYPIIIIPGLKFAELYIDEGTENERGYLSDISVSSVLGGVSEAAFEGIKSWSMDVFMNGLIAYLADAFKYVSCDKNGNSVYDVNAHEYPLAMSNYSEDEIPKGNINEEAILTTAIAHYGADMVYYLGYDWRADPLDNSDSINALVEQAKADHDCDKVNIVSASLGGINTVAYLDEYGYESVNNCVFLSSTICGTYVATDLFQGNVEFSGEGLYNYISGYTKNTSVLNSFVKILYKAGLFDGICDWVNGIFDKYGQEIYDGMLRDVFATVPALWAVVIPEEYQDCLDYLFYTDELKDEYSGVIEKADELQQVISSSESILTEAKDDGVNISIVAGYNSALIPVYKRASSQGDSTLETTLMTGGAKVAEFGETLGDGYTAEDMSMVSPDNVVDMSTAMFPYSTWLIKDAPHVACLVGSDYSAFVFSLVDFNGQPTVDNMTGYSRFMRVDKSQNFIDF